MVVDDRHRPFAVTWRVYQDVIDAYADHDRRRGKTELTRVIDAIRSGLPDGLDELAQLGRTLHRRRADVLAYFEYRASNGPTEAINGRLEGLRRHALGFRNLLHYRIRSLLHCGNLTHAIDALQVRKSPKCPVLGGLLPQSMCTRCRLDVGGPGRTG
ncbi:transposase [Rhodococcus aetherivorans]|uniref:transposase n=1 Tax=Rhodococcus aetherivorans TaxID=191292 RepID=UPI00369FBD8F